MVFVDNIKITSLVIPKHIHYDVRNRTLCLRTPSQEGLIKSHHDVEYQEDEMPDDEPSMVERLNDCLTGFLI